jgi:hypothetical protein
MGGSEMSDGDMIRLEDLRQALISLAQHQRVTVPETAQTVKLGMLADGADPEIVAGFFADLDAVAALHIN